MEATGMLRRLAAATLVLGMVGLGCGMEPAKEDNVIETAVTAPENERYRE